MICASGAYVIDVVVFLCCVLCFCFLRLSYLFLYFFDCVLFLLFGLFQFSFVRCLSSCYFKCFHMLCEFVNVFLVVSVFLGFPVCYVVVVFVLSVFSCRVSFVWFLCCLMLVQFMLFCCLFLSFFRFFRLFGFYVYLMCLKLFCVVL